MKLFDFQTETFTSLTSSSESDQPNLNRRKLLGGLLSGVLLTGIGYNPLISDAFAAPNTSKKVLIVFYSLTGHTKVIANQLKKITGADVVELETVKPYPTTYNAVVAQVRKENSTGYNPPLKTKIPNLNQYDTILLGSPIWYGSVARPILTFLSENNLSGKTVAPFVTHGGTGLGETARTIKQYAPKANVVEGLDVWGSQTESAQPKTEAWAKTIGVAK